VLEQNIFPLTCQSRGRAALNLIHGGEQLITCPECGYEWDVVSEYCADCAHNNPYDTDKRCGIFYDPELAVVDGVCRAKRSTKERVSLDNNLRRAALKNRNAIERASRQRRVAQKQAVV